MRTGQTTIAAAASVRQRTPGVTAWLLMAPLFLWVLLFVVAPTLIMLVYSFCERGTLGGVVFKFTLANYAAVFDATYLRIVIRSILFAGLTTAVCLVMGYPVAYHIGRSSEKWRNILLMLVMIPFWTSFLIRTYAWMTILKSEGLLNSLLVQYGLITQPFEMLYTPGAVVLGLVYTFLPFMILPIYTSVEKLDNALVEAAFDLGAGPMRAFSKVIVPMTSPGITAGILLVFVPALGLYAVNDILGGGKVDMIGNIIENQFKGNARNWPFGAALGIALMAAFGIAFWFTGRRQATVQTS
ncbi:MAG: ABC transporter permease [Deltaproteobacteria bacterium]|nr:ABC transporter permease [Deltaproteobacteria bacterium]